MGEFGENFLQLAMFGTDPLSNIVHTFLPEVLRVSSLGDYFALREKARLLISQPVLERFQAASEILVSRSYISRTFLSF